MSCCTERGANPVRLCPDDPGAACNACLERSGQTMAISTQNNIRFLNDFGAGRVPETVQSVQSVFNCVIL